MGKNRQNKDSIEQAETNSVNDKLDKTELDYKLLENNIGKIYYTLDKAYLSHLNDYNVLNFDKYCTLNNCDYTKGEDPHPGFFLLKVNNFIINKDEKVIDCMKNLIGTFSNTVDSIGLLFHRKIDSVDVYFVFKKFGEADSAKTTEGLELLAKSFNGNFPGSAVELIKNNKDSLEKVKFLKESTSISMLSSVPSDKSEDYISQGIEKLLNGVVPSPTKNDEEYSVLILAESMTQESIRNVINGFEEMATAITPYASHQFQAGKNDSESNGEMNSVTDTTGVSHAISKTHSVNIGVNLGTSKSVGTGESFTRSKTNSTQESTTKNLGGAIGSAGAALGAGLGTIIPGIGNIIGGVVGGAIGTVVGTFIGSKTNGTSFSDTLSKTDFSSITNALTMGLTGGYGYSWGKIDTKTDSNSLTDGTNHNITIGTSENTTYTYKSYLVTNLIQNLEKTIERLTESKSTGLWKTATYVFSNDPSISTSVASYLKGLSQGDDSYIENPNIITWKKGDNENYFEQIKEFITYFIHPIFVHETDVVRYSDGMKNEIKNIIEEELNSNNELEATQKKEFSEKLNDEIEKEVFSNPEIDAQAKVDLIPITPTTNVSTTELAKIFSLPTHSLPGLPVLECAEFGRNVATYDVKDFDCIIKETAIKESEKECTDYKKQIRESIKDKIKEDYNDISSLVNPKIESDKENSDSTYDEGEARTSYEENFKKEVDQKVDIELEKKLEEEIIKNPEKFPSVQMNNILNKKRKISLGKIYHMHQSEQLNVDLSVNSFSSHVFITGSTGSGKSNTIYQILEKLKKTSIYKYESKKIESTDKVKFLVIEPAKGEYKNVFGEDETQEKCDVHVYGTNSKLSNLLRINPFSFPDDIHILEHLDRLVEIFNVCWPMYAAMPAVLKEAVEKSYEDCGWNLTDSTNIYGKDLYPTFADVTRNIRTIIDSSEYDAENKGAYKGSLITRLKSLTNGINGQIFTTEGTPEKDLFDENVIVDLSRVGSTETKSLIMGLLVLKLQEYRMTQASMNSPLKHVTVLEEAHNLLKRTSTEQTSESSNLIGKSVEMLTNAIAEMRTYGEGFIIADQAPGLLDMAVIRNTNTKIIMRLPDLGDRELVGKAANLNDNQIEELAKLTCGVAAVYQNEWVQPVLCEVEYIGEPKNTYKKSKPSKEGKGIKPRLECAKWLCEITHGNHIEKLSDYETVLKGISGSLYVFSKQYVESLKRKPDYNKLQFIISTLLPEFSKTLKNSAIRNPSDVKIWRDDLQEYIIDVLNSQNMAEVQLRNSILQCILQNYIKFELNKPNLLNELVNKKTQ